nr:leucine-rich repeat-containing protein 37B-like [Cavia porcellus]
MDCSEAHTQLACAKLVSRTGLLMKLLSEEEKVHVAKALWDAEDQKSEKDTSENTAESDHKDQKSRELTKVPQHDYYKLILPLSFMGVMILMVIFCLIKMRCHRRALQVVEKPSRKLCEVIIEGEPTESTLEDEDTGEVEEVAIH